MEGHPERIRRQLYGRRKGPKLSPHQASLFQSLLPGLELKLETGRDPRSYFDVPVDEVWLEIGFGGGEHLVWQADRHPRIGLIGAEPYEAGVAKLLSKLAVPAGGGEGKPLRNIRIYQGDARDIIEALPDRSLNCVFLLFPDPWPKTRHHKRRFIQMEILDALSHVMKPGGRLRIASDDSGYVAWMLERTIAHRAFEWTATCANDWKVRAPDWPPTRYEEKALHGIPTFLEFLRA